MKSPVLFLLSCLFILALSNNAHSAPIPTPGKSSQQPPALTIPPTSGGDPSSPGSAASSNAASPVTPENQLETYKATSLRGTGTGPNAKTLTSLFPKAPNPQQLFVATEATVDKYEKEFNAFVKGEFDKKAAADVEEGEDSGNVPEFVFTQASKNLIRTTKAGRMKNCENEKLFGADLICALSLEIIEDGQTYNIVVFIQMKVVQYYKTKTPTVDFTKTNSNGLQLELLAKYVNQQRGEFSSDIIVMGGYGLMHRKGATFIPLGDLLEAYEGEKVPRTADSQRVAFKRVMEQNEQYGYLKNIIRYARAHGSVTAAGAQPLPPLAPLAPIAGTSKPRIVTQPPSPAQDSNPHHSGEDADMHSPSDASPPRSEGGASAVSAGSKRSRAAKDDQGGRPRKKAKTTKAG
ncbi:hypothetical protein FRC17_010521 [Serendipita sp. 399]|nr:hypothetical protein FRC17_010521 [Serendipita sp. 399]